MFFSRKPLPLDPRIYQNSRTEPKCFFLTIKFSSFCMTPCVCVRTYVHMQAGAQMYVGICANMCECTFSSCFPHIDSRCRISLSSDHRTGHNHTTPVYRILQDKLKGTRYIGKVGVKQIVLEFQGLTVQRLYP